jgi:small subunit ribosomal protein S3
VGQKINPIGFRIAINKNWESRWFSTKSMFGEWLHEDLRIRKSIKKEFYNAAIARVLIERATNLVRVTIYCARPGMLIGRKGGELERIRVMVSKLVECRDVIVDVKEVKNAETNAQLVAENIGMQLERRIAFRRAMKKAIQIAMDMGVNGIKVRCGGRLGGAELARVEQYKDGKIPLHTLSANIDYGFAEANTTAGIIGIKVWVCHKESIEEMNNAINAKKGKAQKGAARK